MSVVEGMDAGFVTFTAPKVGSRFAALVASSKAERSSRANDGHGDDLK